MLTLLAVGSHLLRRHGTRSGSSSMAPAFLLGGDALKAELLEPLGAAQVLRLPRLSLRFLRGDAPAEAAPADAEADALPVLVDAPPPAFRPAEYWAALGTRRLGRLLLLAERLPSCMDAVGPRLPEGFAAVALEQTRGVGRGGSAWDSPRGCAMFAVQVLLPPGSYLGRRATLLQHLAALAVVTAPPPGLGLRIKWPNDVLAGGGAKVGGVLVASQVLPGGGLACAVGGGVNLDNDRPTTCLNALAAERGLERLSLERFLALVFTRLEALLDRAQEGGAGGVLQLYYRHWLHGGAEVTVTDGEGRGRRATVLGVDEFGFLLVRDERGVSFSVHSVDNSFDLSRGLVRPKELPPR